MSESLGDGSKSQEWNLLQENAATTLGRRRHSLSIISATGGGFKALHKTSTFNKSPTLNYAGVPAVSQIKGAGAIQPSGPRGDCRRL